MEKEVKAELKNVKNVSMEQVEYGGVTFVLREDESGVDIGLGNTRINVNKFENKEVAKDYLESFPWDIVMGIAAVICKAELEMLNNKIEEK